VELIADAFAARLDELIPGTTNLATIAGGRLLFPRNAPTNSFRCFNSTGQTIRHSSGSAGDQARQAASRVEGIRLNHVYPEMPEEEVTSARSGKSRIRRNRICGFTGTGVCCVALTRGAVPRR
jgi:hypothetical protein